MDNFISLNVLATFAGCVFVVTILVQILKHLVTYPISPKIYNIVLSFIIVMFRQAFIVKEWNAENIVFIFINTLLVFSSAIGLFETAVKPIQRKIDSSKEPEFLKYSEE